MKKQVFSMNASIDKTAYLNWRMESYDYEHNLISMANGFYSASELMLSQLLNNNPGHIADALIFPILYSVNQSIELYEKAIIRLIDKLEDDKVENLQTHDIVSLFNTMLAKIKKHEQKTKGLSQFLAPLKDYLDELRQYIPDKNGNPKMDFARYPFDTEGQAYFYVISQRNVVVDMEYLLQQVNEIKDSLDSLSTMFQVELEYKYAQESYYRE